MRKIISIAAVSICLISVAPVNASSDLVEQLKNCARIQSDQPRIACYEQLGKQVLAADSASETGDSSVSSTNEQVPAADDAKELPDSIGGGKYARDAGVPKEQFTGVLKSCNKSMDRRWFYIFENGQVWKQVRHKKIRHKNCNTTATLTKDGFGYIMNIDGEDRKVRVKRQR